LAVLATERAAPGTPAGGLCGCFLGLINPRRIAILESGDYSYGIYLYSVPIQQAVVAAGWFPRNGRVDLAVSLPLVVLLAFCSWHF
jgi:peptidoglycan/LPS O-acetylase OafA/YrhL